MMETTAANLNQLWANLIVEELARHGITEYCLSPGSRNTPLTIAAARHPRTICHMHFDERGASFRALGYARACGTPAVLVCTSGTAGANYYPAVIEAWQSRVPMLILTANRPPELWDRGANQTIDQEHLFGRYGKWFTRLRCPESESDPSYVLSTIDQAARHVCRIPAGPVHLDCPFREPLAPVGPVADFVDYLMPVQAWLDDSRPFTTDVAGPAIVEQIDLNRLAADFNQVGRGLLIVGRLDRVDQVSAVSRLAERLNWPMVADIQSGLRVGQNLRPLIPYGDLVLSGRTAETEPMTVLHIGEQPTSKRLHQYLKRLSGARYVYVASHRRTSDPNDIVTLRITMDIEAFCDSIVPLLSSSIDEAWRAGWHSQSDAVEEILEQQLRNVAKLTEPLVARLVMRHAPEQTGLWAANSMPIRDLDSFADPEGPTVVVGANRGASGIDGTIASACGFAAGLRAPVTVLIGDLATLHDLNSLAMVAKSEQPVVIVIINNNGGGIFHFLPVTECEDVFEEYFGTGHGLSFEHAAGQFGLLYTPARTADDLTTGLELLHKEKRSGIIEVRTDRRENLECHRQLIESIKAALQANQ